MKSEGVPFSARLAATLLAAFGLLPLVDLVPGGRSWSGRADALSGWASGVVVVAGFGFVLLVAARRAPGWSPERWTARSAEWVQRFRAWPLALGAGAFGLYALIARAVFGARPRFIDEIVQVWQGRLLASGHLSLPAAPYPEFTAVSLIVDWGGKAYGQFPVGGPALLALGTLAHAEWLVVPALGGLGVICFATLLRRLGESPAVTVWGSLLFAVTPFWAFQAGSFMNHVPTVAFLLIGMLGLHAVVAGRRARWGAFVAGAGFAIAGTIRPLDGVVFAGVAFLWLSWRAVRRERGTDRWSELALATAGAALPALAVGWSNLQTTGAATRFGYSVAWGAAHGLGFHAAPWGPHHTPVAGLELLSLYLLRLQSALFETPFPSLLPAIAALWLARRLLPFDRFLIATAILLSGAYGAYWHNGDFLGPRFLVPLVPLLVLWTARAPGLVLDRLGRTALAQWILWVGVASVPVTLLWSIPPRVTSYRSELITPRWDADSAAAREGIVRGLVFVRESWGAQLIARMWGLGVSRADAEFLYHRVDACRLDAALDGLEGTELRGSAATDRLRPLASDSAQLEPSPFSPDRSERFLPGQVYGDRCRRRIAEDNAGFTLHAPLILAGRPGNTLYARDLHGRDSLLLQGHPGRPLWSLTADANGVPRFHRIPLDSAWSAWRRGE